jgi:hypothetical protein
LFRCSGGDAAIVLGVLLARNLFLELTPFSRLAKRRADFDEIRHSDPRLKFDAQ